MQKLPPESLLHRLDLAVRMRLYGSVHGEAIAFGVRGGVEFERVRPWTPGDDWRLLDAAATARTAEPHVRVPVAERRMTLWLGIDVSSSMAFGTQQWEKADLATSVAAAFGLIALRQSARVGALALGVGDETPIPPRAGKPALLSLVEQLSPVRDDLDGDLTAAIARLDRVVRQRSVVIIISDFRDETEWHVPLRRIAARNETICVEVHDPREREVPNVGVARFLDPETGRTFTIDTASRRFRERFANRAVEHAKAVAHGIRSSGADYLRIGTDENWLESLMRHMDQRRRRRWTSPTR